MKTQQFDLIIVGGGMVGLALAQALRGQQMTIAIVERAWPAPALSLGRDLRVSAHVAGTVNILKGLDLWPRLEKAAAPIRTMRVWDNQSFGAIRFEAAEIAADSLGHIIENSVLHAALLDAVLANDQVTMLCPMGVQSISVAATQASLLLDDGRTLSAPLLVGADGARSWVRDQLGIGCYLRPYGQKAIVATVRSRLSHQNQAFQRFLPTGPLAFLPLTGGTCSIVWSAETDLAEQLMALDNAAFAEALDSAFGPVLGGVLEVGERQALPLTGRLAHHQVRERIALIGDAAHVIHPLAGLGVNLGLRDAMTLAQEISDARRFEEDYGEMAVLNRLLRYRAPDTLATAASMEAFHRLFTTQSFGLPWLRDSGMVLASNSGLLKKMLMRRAMGLSVPVPTRVV